jgi:hypothetical protein
MKLAQHRKQILSECSADPELAQLYAQALDDFRSE